MFGIDSTLLATADFHVLDLNSFTWQTNYYANGPTSNATDSPGTTSNNGNSASSSTSYNGGEGISSGAIAGIAVAAVAVVRKLQYYLFYFIF
jgi:hypothetical protein